MLQVKIMISHDPDGVYNSNFLGMIIISSSLFSYGQFKFQVTKNRFFDVSLVAANIGLLKERQH